MRIRKMIFVAAIAVTICSCSQEYVKKEAVDSLKAELEATKKDQAILQSQYIRQNEDISEILSQLSAISGKTQSLRINVENGSAKIAQAQQIEDNIAEIKKKLGELKSQNAALSSKGSEFEKIIANLQQVVIEKEKEIAELKQEISEKDNTIKEQQTAINLQLKTISEQKSELESKVEQQARMLYEAGAFLDELGDSAPAVSWKSNKKKVAAMSQTIYHRALLYYTEALEAGYPAEEAIESVKSKITE